MTEYDEPVGRDETSDIPLSSQPLDARFLLEPIRKLMHTQLATVTENQTVQEAVTIMAEHSYGCVLVVRDEQLIGIFTERDLLKKVVGGERNPRLERVGDHMTPDPETLRPEDEVAYALRAMMLGGFRHVPLVNEDQQLVGIFSLRDLKQLVMDHFEREISTLPPQPHYRGPNSRFGA